MKYLCMEPIEHDQQRFDVGAEISLPEEAAAPLLAIGHVAPLVKKTKGARPEAEAAGGDPTGES